MNAHGVSLYARGMHCPGCEHIIEDAVRKLSGVRQVKADYSSETVAVSFDPTSMTIEQICAAIAQKGYRCAPSDQAPLQSNRLKKLAGLVVGVVGILLIILLDARWISQGGAPDITQHMSYGLILALGLLTGFHCIGMCGGFVLSYAADDARLGRRSYVSHFLYGAGKTLSYTAIGALFGLIGAFVAFTPLLRGAAGVVAGAFLIVFGLNMLNLFKPLRRIRLHAPAAIDRFLGKQAANRHRPFAIGLLNGLMIACGPLQAMYVMAAGTGSAVEGAKMLFTFGVGTLPVLLSFGVLTTLISGSLTHQLLRASGVIVVILGAVMINRGLILIGSGHDLASVIASLSRTAEPPPGPTAETAVQTIFMDATAAGYSPNYFILRKGKPVRWVIDGKEVTSCNHRILVPKLGLEFDVKPGLQVIEFTPNEEGVIPWSCWMGMLHGEFIVIGEPATPPPAAASEPAAPPPPGPATEPQPSARAPIDVYTIQSGDTLAGVASKLYRNPQAWRDIAKANPGLDPRRLRPGQTIKLPRPDAGR